MKIIYDAIGFTYSNCWIEEGYISEDNSTLLQSGQLINHLNCYNSSNKEIIYE